VTFTRPRGPTQDNICPFVYHYFMTFLKPENIRNPAESNKSAYGIDRHIRAVVTNKTQRRACSVGSRRHDQALCLLYTQRPHCITIKRRAGSELDGYSRDSDQFYPKVSNDARYPEISRVIVPIRCITVSNLVRIYQSVRNPFYSFFAPLSRS